MAREADQLPASVRRGVRPVRAARPGAGVGGDDRGARPRVLRPGPRTALRRVLAAPLRRHEGGGMSAERISTADAPAPSGAYSQGIAAGGLLFLAGQGPFDSAGDLVDGSIEAQVRQVFANLDAVARAAGATLNDAVRVGVYLSDLAHF